MKKKILIVTSTRADYGLMKNLIFLLKIEKKFQTKILAAGNHFDNKFGNTYKEIERDKVKIDFKIKLKIKGDKAFDIANFFSKQSSKLNYILNKKFKPDLAILLGDRFEILSVASILKIYTIPICHLHGGESTSGLIDEKIRHAISKLSSIHFVSHDRYKKKLIKMGENPKFVYNFGALGLNNIKTSLLTKSKLEKMLQVKLNKKTFLVSFHPETLNKTTNKSFESLLKAIEEIKNEIFIFTSPNMDESHNYIITKINSLVKKRKHTYYFNSLGKKLYFSLLKYIDGVIGNSSSGIIEVPSFNITTLNIGNRQGGRLQSKTIINAKPITRDILKKIKMMIDTPRIFNGNNNIYYKKNTEKKIVEIIKNINLKRIKD